MHFVYPQALTLLWLLLPLLWLFLYSHRRGLHAASAFAEPARWQALGISAAKTRGMIASLLLLTGMVCLILGAARPRWGTYFAETHVSGADLLVVLDVSRSMLAEDVAPNRLERAKSDIRDLLSQLQGDRVGLIAFAGTASVEVPLTFDHAYFRDALARMHPDTAARGGSMVGDAIRKALDTFDLQNRQERIIVLVSDGEDQDSYPELAAQQAAAQNVKIIAIGLGDPQQAARIPADSSGSYVQHEGQEVRTQLDEALLRRLALASGGAYIPARTRNYDLGEIYQRHIVPLTRSQVDGRTQLRYHERYQLFVAIGLVLLLLAHLTPSYPRQHPDAAADPEPLTAQPAPYDGVWTPRVEVLERTT